MIKLNEIPKNDPKYRRGLRFTMNVNEFITFSLTRDCARELRDNLNRLLNEVKE